MAGGFVGIALGFCYILLPSLVALRSSSIANPSKELFVLGPLSILVLGTTNLVLFEAFLAVATTLTLIGPYYLLQGAKDSSYHW